MENRVEYVKTAAASLFIALMVASFSQSCSVTKAGISRLIAPVAMVADNTSVKPIFRPFKAMYTETPVITQHEEAKLSEQAIPKDTTNYNRMILINQELSLLNEKKILDLLLQKDIENKKLKTVNAKLSKKTVITKEEKEDAISMQAIWQTGNTIMLLCFVIIGLLVIQNIALFIYYRSNRYKS